jgi:predicted transcriptional regulator
MPKETLAVRIDDEMRNRIDTLAEGLGQSRSTLINEALRQYVDHQEWQVEIIRSRSRALASGSVAGVPHDQATARLAERYGNRSG